VLPLSLLQPERSGDGRLTRVRRPGLLKVSNELFALAPEVEVDSRRITEIVLIQVVEPIAKVSQQIVDPGWSNRYSMTHWNVYTTAKSHGKGIARRAFEKAQAPTVGVQMVLNALAYTLECAPPNKR